jgi:hypothetical protein
MKSDAQPRKPAASSRPPLASSVLAELRTLAKLWGNPGDDVDATPPRHLRTRRGPRRG